MDKKTTKSIVKIDRKNMCIAKTELATSDTAKIYTEPIYLDIMFHPEKVIINILPIKSTNSCP